MKKRILFSFLTALLVFMMHSRADAAPMLFEKDGLQVGYDDGFVIKAQDQFMIKFGAWLQFQHEYINYDDSRPNTSGFKVAKGRLRWSGFMFNPNLGYVIQLELADPSKVNETDNDRTKDVSLKDFAIDIKHYEKFNIRIGQFKVPFNRQQLAFFGDLQFVDTSLASKSFNANQTNARDIGIMLNGGIDDHKIEYFFGLFNGNGINQASNNDNTQYLTVARVVLNPFGRMSISESDVNDTQHQLLSIGAAFAHDGGNTNAATPGTASTLAFEFAYKYQGISAQGEYYFRDANNNPDANGGYVQGGIFVKPKTVEVAVRYALLNPSGGNNNVEELTAGVNFFFAGHRRKLQIDLSNISSDAGDTDDQRIRTQYQISF